jgi:hypothetical protein
LPRTDRQAVERAVQLYESRGFRTAFMRGYHARRAGRRVEACPYKGGGYERTGRRLRKNTSWAWAWRAAWIAGWEFAG